MVFGGTSLTRDKPELGSMSYCSGGSYARQASINSGNNMKCFPILLSVIWISQLSAQPPDTRVFVGQVTDHKGRPIKGAAVEWGQFDWGRKSRQVVRTDEDGKYRLETTQWGIDYRLGVSAAGFAPQWRDGALPRKVDQGQGKPINFQLKLPLKLKGYVVDQDGNPVKGVTVIAQYPSTGVYSSFSMPTPRFPFPGPERSATSDENGNFVIRNLPTTMMLAKEAEKGQPFGISIRTPAGTYMHGKAYSKLDNQFQVSRNDMLDGEDAKGHIKGKVYDAETEEPITDFVIVIRHRPKSHAFSDPNGQFRMSDLRTGKHHQLYVYAKGYAPHISTLPVRSITAQHLYQFPLEREPSLQGVVVNNQGEPIEGAKIVFGFGPQDPMNPNNGNWRNFDELVDGYLGLRTVQRFTTRNDGVFWFSLITEAQRAAHLADNLGMGKSISPRLMIQAPGYARSYVSEDQLKTKDAGKRIEIQLDPESVVNVRVLVRGDLSPNTRVSVTGSERLYAAVEQPQFDGRQFTSRGLTPGTYRIRATATVDGHNISFQRSVELAVADVQDVTINYDPGTLTLSGKAPVYSSVSAEPVNQADHPDLESISTTTSPDGEYSLTGLKPGDYRVRYSNARSRQNGFFMNRQRDEPVVVSVTKDTTHDFVNNTPRTINIPLESIQVPLGGPTQ